MYVLHRLHKIQLIPRRLDLRPLPIVDAEDHAVPVDGEPMTEWKLELGAAHDCPAAVGVDEGGVLDVWGQGLWFDHVHQNECIAVLYGNVPFVDFALAGIGLIAFSVPLHHSLNHWLNLQSFLVNRIRVQFLESGVLLVQFFRVFEPKLRHRCHYVIMLPLRKDGLLSFLVDFDIGRQPTTKCFVRLIAACRAHFLFLRTLMVGQNEFYGYYCKRFVYLIYWKIK